MGDSYPYEDGDSYEEVHRVRVRTHGRSFDLELEPNPHLLSRGGDSKGGGGLKQGVQHQDSSQSISPDAWYADGYKTNVTYSPGPKVSLNLPKISLWLENRNEMKENRKIERSSGLEP